MKTNSLLFSIVALISTKIALALPIGQIQLTTPPKSMPVARFLELISSDAESMAKITVILETKLRESGASEEIVQKLLGTIKSLIENKNFQEVEAKKLPQIQMSQADSIRSIIGAMAPASKPIADENDLDMIDLVDYVKQDQCKELRAFPAPVANGAITDLYYGHMPSFAISSCRADESKRLSEVLSAVAQGQSRVFYHGAQYSTIKPLVAEILKTHKVVMKNERMHADFIGFTYVYNDEAYSVEWPVWLNTGLKKSNGDEVIIPMGHTQHQWSFSVPELNADITFYLGIHGVGFFADTSLRPEWSHRSTVYSISSSADESTVLNSFEFAEGYFALSNFESQTVASGKPADGYGFVGVCNDSTAALEVLTNPGTSASSFPLVRKKSLKSQSYENQIRVFLGDDSSAMKVFKALQSLPSDFEELPNTPAEKAEWLRRIQLMGN